MANEIASIGITLETDSVSKGIASLGQLVQQGVAAQLCPATHASFAAHRLGRAAYAAYTSGLA